MTATSKQTATLQLVAAISAPGMKIASAVVLAPPAIDTSRLMTPGMSNAVWTVERGHLDDLMNSPALRGYLRHGVPVIACFEDADDAERCQVAFQSRVARHV
jgi:hypothetical protein